jgi:hypothetical protein
VVRDEVEIGPSTSGYATRGVSWVGLGWISHYGRLVTIPLYGGVPTYSITATYFETSSGELITNRWNTPSRWFEPKKNR